MTITLLPNGQQQYFDNSGNPAANGTVTFYIPSTTTPKNTWQDPGQVTLNTNPVQLDSHGRATIYGYGAYRQILQDSLGNTIWDKTTQDTAELVQDGSLIWGGTATGAVNAFSISLTPPTTQRQAGQRFAFIANNTVTGATTLAVDGRSPVSVVVNGTSPVGAGNIASGQVCEVVDDGTNYQLVNPVPQPPAAMPTGSLTPFAGSSAPSGWLLCAGQAVSRTTFAALFAVISTTYGPGDGSTTFNVPDLRGRTPFGQDNMGGSAAGRITSGGSGIQGTTLGASGGLETVGLTAGQNAAHSHQYTTPSSYSVQVGTLGVATFVAASAGTQTTSVDSTGAPHQNMPPALITLWLIKT